MPRKEKDGKLEVGDAGQVGLKQAEPDGDAGDSADDQQKAESKDNAEKKKDAGTKGADEKKAEEAAVRKGEADEPKHGQ